MHWSDEIDWETVRVTTLILSSEPGEENSYWEGVLLEAGVPAEAKKRYVLDIEAALLLNENRVIRTRLHGEQVEREVCVTAQCYWRQENAIRVEGVI